MTDFHGDEAKFFIFFEKKYSVLQNRQFSIGDFEKLSFFESAILNFFFQKKNFFFASFPLKSVQIYMVEWMGRNFDVFFGFPGFQQIPCYA